MTKIYLIRHAEAEGNLYRRIQGHWDGRVTPRGERQIDALAERFRGTAIDALYSSDLQRTRETAGAITRYHDLEVHVTPRLREINMGAWEGRPWGNAEHETPEQMYFFNHDPDRWSIPGCESFPAVQQRMQRVLSELAAQHEGQTIAVVSHGTAIRTYLAARLGIASGEIGTLAHGDNTCVAKLEFENGAVHVAYHNDASHLPEELSTFTRQTWWKGVDKDPGNLRMEQMTFTRICEIWNGAESGMNPSTMTPAISMSKSSVSHRMSPKRLIDPATHSDTTAPRKYAVIGMRRYRAIAQSLLPRDIASRTKFAVCALQKMPPRTV